MAERLYGGIEAGGTKWVCAIGTGPEDIRAEIRFPTTTPDETLGQAIAFFRAHQPAQLAAIGVGSFGPVDLNRASPRYGFITTTPSRVGLTPMWLGRSRRRWVVRLGLTPT